MSSRPTRSRAPRGVPVAGRELVLSIGSVAHGGHCVARIPADEPEVGGTVVFVRHSLPGEVARVRLTEGFVGDRFLRGDAVEVLEASPDRVQAPCPVAGPGLCGGCDFQHVALPSQRSLKGQVVSEQLRRLAGLDLEVTVEPVPGDVDGLGWRTRMRYVRDTSGRLGLRAHRSRRVVPVDDCLIASPEARVLVEEADGRTVADGGASRRVREQVADRWFTVAADGFWQVHAGAPEALVGAVLEAAAVRPGDRVLDLYAGVGLFTAFLAQATGPTGLVHAVEGDRTAVEHARENLTDLPWAELSLGSVDRILTGGDERSPQGEWDVVVLDPPREGARRPVVEAVVARAPRTVVYVACDPAALARDVALFAERGYRLDAIRAFDLFPMTHHVECVALLTKTGSDLR